MADPDYYWPLVNDDGVIIGAGAKMTSEEIAQVNPTEGRLRQLTDAVDQLILDSLGA